MLQQYASHIVDFLYKNTTLDKSKRAIYQYGTELTLSTVTAIVSILCLAVLLGNIFWGITFLIVFFSLRIPGGGYHATSYRNCFILSNCVFLFTYSASTFFLNFSNSLVLTLLLGSCAIILVLAPISNPHHPISNDTFRKNKCIVRGFIIVGTTLILLGKWLMSFHSLFSIYSASVVAVAAMMILAKLRGGTINE